MATVAVMGSCVTRDVFNTRFNPDYKDDFVCPLTQNQTSLLSLMSAPVEAEVEPVGAMSEYDRWNVRTELSKEFLDALGTVAPDYLLLDFFADVHFGVLELPDGRFVTNNWWKVWRTTWYAGLADRGEVRVLTHASDPERYEALWIDALDRFLAHVREVSPSTRLVVHRGHYVRTAWRKGRPKPVSLNKGRRQPIDVDASNALWSRLDDLAARRSGADVIDLTGDRWTSTDEHPWGPFFVHFTPEYYPRFLTELRRLHLAATAPPQVARLAAAIRAVDAAREAALVDRVASQRERIVSLRERLRRAQALAASRSVRARAGRVRRRVAQLVGGSGRSPR